MSPIWNLNQDLGVLTGSQWVHDLSVFAMCEKDVDWKHASEHAVDLYLKPHRMTII